jgi:hypothetical protein
MRGIFSIRSTQVAINLSPPETQVAAPPLRHAKLAWTMARRLCRTSHKLASRSPCYLREIYLEQRRGEESASDATRTSSNDCGFSL